MTFLATIEDIFEVFVRWGILLLEVSGVVILLVTAVRSIVGLIRKDPHVRLNLAEGIALSLEFKLGSEVLRTVIVRTWDELAILGAVVVLRAAITFLLFWEIKKERSEIDIRRKVLHAAIHTATMHQAKAHSASHGTGETKGGEA